MLHRRFVYPVCEDMMGSEHTSPRADGRLLTMLTESDDQPPPEAPVSVASVQWQEPARRTAPAIASLIDDDPEAPF